MRKIGSVVACLVLVSCPSGDDSSGTSGGGTSGVASSEASTGGTTAPTMVQCDATVCGDGELCVWPPSQCDYSETAGMIVREDRACMLFPVACDGMADDALVECLRAEFCSASASPSPSYEMGVLDCPPAWLDCF